MTLSAPSTRPARTPRHTTNVCWQGWRLEMPERWSPVKLEGDFAKGFALFADLHRPRLGLRWDTPARSKAKSFDPAKLQQRVMRDEVGKLAAAEARGFETSLAQWPGSLIYLDPKPPGRDVWVGFSPESRRIVEIIYHARHRDRSLEQTIVPMLEDFPTAENNGTPWSIFELNCVAPLGFSLAHHRLIAGDLGLTFAKGRDEVSIRQIAVAELALSRQPLEGWLDRQLAAQQRYYRTVGEPTKVEMQASGRTLTGLSRPTRRRRRFSFMRNLPPQRMTYALHDVSRDRLVLASGTDPRLVQDLISSVGPETVA